ncbi:hypothetical protein CEXT_152701 [Caerostris extrusa]|uniref:Uncharacterized protein n=1 Tax=Caerostris extrusa TaxID=172846 RepID=A0AAV4XD74_CAEEX|nr:hypothetical protein CEXT_152701 [Caerostris extrusa]
MAENYGPLFSAEENLQKYLGRLQDCPFTDESEQMGFEVGKRILRSWKSGVFELKSVPIIAAQKSIRSLFEILNIQWGSMAKMMDPLSLPRNLQKYLGGIQDCPPLRMNSNNKLRSCKANIKELDKRSL